MGRVNPWIVLLLVSVALNGVLIGATARDRFAPAAAPVAGETGGERRDEGFRPRRGGFDIQGFVSALPEVEREAARERFEAARPELRRLAREAFQARQAADDALSAEPLDAQAALDALAAARTARSALEARTEAIVLEAAASVDPETRRDAFREAFGFEPGRWRERRERSEP